MSVHARVVGSHPARQHQSEGVTTPAQGIDRAALIAAATTNPALSDRATRVYALIVVAYPTAEVQAPMMAEKFHLTHKQAGQALGELVTAGLLTKRMRVVGYKPAQPKPLRIRRYAYRLAGGAA